MNRRWVVALLALVLLRPALVRADGPLVRIGPGHEALAAEMLGEGVTLPAGCAWRGAAIEADHVLARYGCESVPRPLELALWPRGARPVRALQTRQFDVVADPADAFPPPLLAALAASIASREDRWHWDEGSPERRAATSPGDPRGHRRSWFSEHRATLRGLLRVALAAVALSLAALAAGRRARPASERAFGLMAGFGILVLALALALASTAGATAWGVDHDINFQIASSCAHGRGCPLVGPSVQATGWNLGPLFFYVLALLLRVTPSPDGLYFVSVACCAGAAVVTGRAGARWLGSRAGHVAGVLFAWSPVVTTILATFGHPPMVVLPLAVGVSALVAWASGGGDRPLGLCLGALAVATQMHGIALLVLPAVAGTALWVRPRGTWRGWLVGAAVFAVLYAPWVVHLARTGVPAVRPLLLSPTAGEGPPAWLLGSIAVAAVSIAVRARPRAPAPVRGGARALLLTLVVPLGLMVGFGSRWSAYYSIVFCPAVTLGLAAAIAGASGHVLDRARDVASAGRWRVVALGVAAVALGAVSAARAGDPSQRAIVAYREQLEIVRRLSLAGFGRADFPARVHGAVWDPDRVGSWYLRAWLLPADRHADAGTQAVILEGCRSATPGFAASQSRIESPAGQAVLALYRSELSAPVVEIARDGEPCFEGPWPPAPAHPMIARFLAASIRPDGVLPGVPPSVWPRSVSGAVTGELEPFVAALRCAQARQPVIRVRTTLTAGASDRVLVVNVDPNFAVSVRARGVVLEPVADTNRRPDGQRARRYRFTAEERRAGPTPLELAISGGPPSTARVGLPFPLEIYEEPWPLCGP